MSPEKTKHGGQENVGFLWKEMQPHRSWFDWDLTRFEDPELRDGSSYAATFSQVATTACVGVNLASGNPRETSWMRRWTHKWAQGRGKNKTKKKEHRRWSMQLNQLIIPMLVCWARWEFPSPGNKSAPARRWCRCQPGTAPQQGNPWGNHRLRTAFPSAGPGLIRFRWWPPRATGGRW